MAFGSAVEVFLCWFYQHLLNGLTAALRLPAGGTGVGVAGHLERRLIAIVGV
ncbi:hypothetical protein O23A_P4p0025 (plasmid) [Aeromonas salmonicida]|nr:hypothetical protein O23A_P4p0025 [Aeromonas salmonicida]